ncbi:hypothetical protein ACFWN5_19135 [Streptomyces sp. NPDC058430]|uniref:hypothetical protein n=1 Tax=Streptomyces sp. NPDC058430 TaxID=3346495 RepID=UPI003650FD71
MQGESVDRIGAYSQDTTGTITNVKTSSRLPARRPPSWKYTYLLERFGRNLLEPGVAGTGFLGIEEAGDGEAGCRGEAPARDGGDEREGSGPVLGADRVR